MKNSKVSLIVSTYNRPEYLLETIKSFLEQTYLNKEMIVIDDGSDKNKYHDIKKFCKGNKIRYYRYKHDRVSVQLNRGIKKAKGKYLCTLGDDDLFYSRNSLQIRMNYLNNNPDCDVLFSGWVDINDKGKIQKHNKCPEIDKNRIFKTDYINIHTITWHKRISKKNDGYFPEDCINNEDWEFKIKCIMECNCQKIDNITARTRRWGGCKSCSNREQTILDGNRISKRMNKKYKEFIDVDNILDNTLQTA